MDLLPTAWLEIPIAGNTADRWLLGLATFVLTILVALGVRGWLRRWLRGFSVTTETDLDDFIGELAARTRLVLLVGISLWVGSYWLELPDRVRSFLDAAATLAALMQVAIWAAVGIDFWVARYKQRRLEEDAASATTVTALRFLGKLGVYSVLLLLALDNLGFEVGALVTGLGIGGVAVALAVQNILGDLFASLSIVLDKPFVIGDFVVVGEFAGTVENIGLKTTRIKSLSGEQLVFSNSDLLSSRIRNYKRMAERRIVFRFGVVYQTPADKLERIPEMITEILEGLEQARLDRAHFQGFGESSFDFEVVYYVTVPEYQAYMDCQQTINLALVRRFEREGIAFAYPTRTLYVEGESPRRGR